MIWRLRKLEAESPKYMRLDALRIVASLGIVTFHWRGAMEWQPATDASDWVNSWQAFVDLFFTISGFIIAAVYSSRIETLRQFGDFLKKRFLRLAPLHYAILVLYILIGILAMTIGIPLNEPEKYDPRCIVPNLLFIHAMGTCAQLTYNFPSWSISAEAFCYVMFPLVLVLYRIRPWLPLAIGAGLIAVLYTIGPAGPAHRPWYDWTWDFGALRALPAFMIGVGFFGLRDRFNWVPAPGALMMLALCALCFVGLTPLHDGIAPLLAYLLAFFAIIADARRPPGQFIRAIAPFGQLTYSTYMLHAPIMTLLFTLILDRTLHLAPFEKFCAVVASYGVLLVVSYFSFTLFEDPIRRLRLSGTLAKVRTAP